MGGGGSATALRTRLPVSPGHGNTAPVYAIKDICSGRAMRGREGEVSLDSGARNGEYAANIRTLGVSQLKKTTYRGTKRYAQQCITPELP